MQTAELPKLGFMSSQLPEVEIRADHISGEESDGRSGD
jgi:hypothetical protein